MRGHRLLYSCSVFQSFFSSDEHGDSPVAFAPPSTAKNRKLEWFVCVCEFDHTSDIPFGGRELTASLVFVSGSKTAQESVFNADFGVSIIWKNEKKVRILHR